MDNFKPEKVEHPDKTSKVEVEKADVKLRELERTRPTHSDASKKELTLENLEPNTTYEKNGFTFQTNDLKRTYRASCHLTPDRIEKASRNPKIQAEVRQEGKKGDVGGHIFAAEFGGPADAFNMFPQNKVFNMGKWSESGWKNIENEWKTDLTENKTVDATVELRSSVHTKRPTELYVSSTVSGVKDGKPEVTSFEYIYNNQAQNQIRYFSAVKR
jgi:hypothetical protein